MVPAVFKDVKPSAQLLLFFCFWVLFFVVFGLVSEVLVNRVFHLPRPSPELEQGTINEYKVVQLITSIGIFVLPALLIIRLFTKEWWKWLKLHTWPNLNALALVVVLFFTAIPVLNVLIEWNAAIQLPEAFATFESFVLKMESEAEQLTLMFLKTNGLSGLFLNVVLIALVPAIGEELLFRGVFQQLFQQWKGNAHVAIWAAACLFSLMHFQFYGFFPRMVLGALFGYLFYWSGSLWLPIFAHFVNNASAVLIAYYGARSGLQEKIDAVGTGEHNWYYTLPSILMLGMVLWLFQKDGRKRLTAEEQQE
jgi:membrane protease YdiL (CAAX protease family)